jgi:hypothetical protein
MITITKRNHVRKSKRKKIPFSNLMIFFPQSLKTLFFMLHFGRII